MSTTFRAPPARCDLDGWPGLTTSSVRTAGGEPLFNCSLGSPCRPDGSRPAVDHPNERSATRCQGGAVEDDGPVRKPIRSILFTSLVIGEVGTRNEHGTEHEHERPADGSCRVHTLKESFWVSAPVYCGRAIRDTLMSAPCALDRWRGDWT
jgi:hypothetical protein